MYNNERISAEAAIRGSAEYPLLRGYAYFTRVRSGTQVYITLTGLPVGGECAQRIFGAHIHEGGACSGTAADPFANAGAHYNPAGCEHPYHAGDMPPIFSAGSNAMLAFVTDRFTPEEVIGKTVIIHAHPDNLHTQPSGNSGEKIACGVIMRRR